MAGNTYTLGVHTGLTPPQLFFLIFLDEGAKQLGVEDIVGFGLAVLGQPLIPTRRKAKGTTAGTSFASKFLREKLPYKFKRPMATLTTQSILRLRFAYTNEVGAFVGRWIPFVGWALLARDLFLTSEHTVMRYNRLVKTEDKVL